MERPKVDESWSGMTFKGASQNALAAGAKLTLAEKIAWLEEAQRTAIRLGALPDPKAPAGPPE